MIDRNPDTGVPATFAARIGSLPRVGALRRTPARIREHPWIAVAITAGAILGCAWIAWAIVVAGEHGGREALGVLIVWPAIIAAAALIAAPFIGGYLLIRRQAGDSAEPDPGAAEADEAELSEPG
jgi:hypothetical protein